MKQISLRKFRDSIPLIREPVAVSRRDPEGNYQILGTWTPSVTYEPDPVGYVAMEGRHLNPDGTIEGGGHWTPAIRPVEMSGFGESRPAPKPRTRK